MTSPNNTHIKQCFMLQHSHSQHCTAHKMLSIASTETMLKTLLITINIGFTFVTSFVLISCFWLHVVVVDLAGQWLPVSFLMHANMPFHTAHCLVAYYFQTNSNHYHQNKQANSSLQRIHINAKLIEVCEDWKFLNTVCTVHV